MNEDGAAADRRRRWRLVLGGPAQPALGDLAAGDAHIDQLLDVLYDGAAESRRGGLGASAPRVARWLADIRRQFPRPVVKVLQRDAVERLDLVQLLAEPEVLEDLTPDVHLAATLLALRDALPERALASARRVVADVVEEVRRQLQMPAVRDLLGAVDRSARGRRPRRTAEVDWGRTIRANLRWWSPELGTVVPERLVGYARRRQGVRKHVVIALDTSASMADSVVYASILASVLAGVPSLSTRLLAFDTSQADLSAHLDDAVATLFGVQLGGGTDINRAVAVCEGWIASPRDTVLVLVSDLFEGGDASDLLRRMRRLVEGGVAVVALLALSDAGAPAHDHDLAAALATLGCPAFACTPDRFAPLVAAALEGRDLARWAHGEGLV